HGSLMGLLGGWTFCHSDLGNTMPPTVKVRLTKPSRHGELSMLEYSVLGFYPQETTTAVTSTDTLANGDWSYQLHSYLEFRPQRRESVTYSMQESTSYLW
uniref:Immunoglobulin C1-set domain-containing protein n=1 Tax=Hucho hucho TaxID=62062 RepID=A0A4W5PNS2_9TELE